MSWRFRTSFSPPPGVRITLSPEGVFTSVESGSSNPADDFHEDDAARVFSPSDSLSIHSSHGFLPQTAPPGGTIALAAIRSASAGSLPTPGLSEFKGLLDSARRELASIGQALGHASKKETHAVKAFRSWEKGWLLRHCFKGKFEKLRESAELNSAMRAELEEQWKLSQLRTEFELPEGVVRAFNNMHREFAVLMNSQRIWDTVGHRGTDRVAERTAATRTVERQPVKFQLGSCELIESGLSVPRLGNANGGELFFYPLFVLYFISAENFALLEYKNLKLEFEFTPFIERDSLPRDAVVVGHTWAKANKDGTPDKRFNDNHEIPIAKYGKISIQSTTGLNEEYMASNPEAAESFSSALMAYSKAILAGS